MCDNTDCKTYHLFGLLEVELIDDFDKDRCYWCQDCIDRDSDMIERIISKNK